MNHTENIRAVLELASPEQRAAGEAWYERALDVMEATAAQFDLTVEQVAGVTAAVSPRNSWPNNVALTKRLLLQHHDGQPLTGYLGIGLRKAERILAGEPVLDVLRSEKVRAFYACIVTGGATDEVCIDRHAYSIAWNLRTTEPSVTASAYRRIAAAYRAVAAETGLRPPHVQAITWVVWRDLHAPHHPDPTT